MAHDLAQFFSSAPGSGASSADPIGEPKSRMLVKTIVCLLLEDLGMASLRASTQGLEIIDRARKQRGWNRQSSAWYQMAHTTLPTLKRFWQQELIQQETFIKICEAVGVDRWQAIVDDSTLPVPVLLKPHQDWGEAPDVSAFYGRTEELSALEQWIVSDRCRLVALIGMVGIGKTALSAKLAEQIQHEFEFLIWRSLRSAPPMEEVLADLIQFLSNESETNLSQDVDGISCLINCLRKHRCLLVLDNLETIMRSGDIAGHYREGYKSYGEFFKRVGEERHQSCLILTSREKTGEIALLAGTTLPVRSLKLEGLSEEAAGEIFKEKGLSQDGRWGYLTNIYRGNPLFLKIVSTFIKDLFDGSVLEFLKQSRTLITGDISDFIEKQFNRLSKLEQEIMNQLAREKEPVELSKLQEILSPVSPSKLSQALESLGRRSLIEKASPTLIEKSAARFTLQPAVMEYVNNRLGE
jgi:predicted transcriptional regulator